MHQISPAATACRPWCAEPGIDPGDHMCQRIIHGSAYGEILLSHTPQDGPMVNLYDTRRELPLADAEQLAYAILSAVAAARTAVTA